MTETVLPEHLDGPITAFADDLRERMGGNLHSVTVYGSAARGDFVEGASDLNLLVVAKELPVEALRAGGEAVRHWRQRMPISPVFATPDYLTNSADVFPLEFLDMRDSHVTVYGQDPFAGLVIDPAMLRHEVEAELKGKLMRLRSAYARTGGNPPAVRDLLRDSLASFRVLFQGVLRLKGDQPPAGRGEIMGAVARAYGLDAEALQGVVDVHESGSGPASGDINTLFGRYLSAIEKLVGIVDTWDGTSVAGF